MKIAEIETIPHAEQSYETVGDYYVDQNDTLQIRVSDTGNKDYNFLIALHELIEAHLCLKEGISFEDITNFDKRFERMRKSFPDLIGEMEPGDHDSAPYQKQHKIASMMEKWLCENMQIDYETYNKAVNDLWLKRT